MYFSDMSRYASLSGQRRWLRDVFGPRVVHVGWLDEGHPFPRGEVAGYVLDRLFELCRNAAVASAEEGYHACPFCARMNGREAFGLREEWGGMGVVLGARVIRVVTPKLVYAAPDLIFHYVAAHGYLPPVEFLEAVGRTEMGRRLEFSRN